MSVDVAEAPVEVLSVQVVPEQGPDDVEGAVAHPEVLGVDGVARVMHPALAAVQFSMDRRD